MAGEERLLKLLLRIIGTAGLTAIFAAAMPYSWMNAIHKWLGLGELPNEPIVGYLARSASAFYAILGGLFWVVSFDLHRHRAVLFYLGIVIILFGATLFVVDLREGMPLYWLVGEGPFTVIFGVVILFLSHRIDAEHTRQ